MQIVKHYTMMLLSILLSNLCGGVTISALLISQQAKASYAGSIDGEYGTLKVTGELVDSPCKLSMKSRDQSVDIGVLSTTDLEYPGARSTPVIFTVQLQGCLVAAGSLSDEKIFPNRQNISKPTVNIAFTAPSEYLAPDLIEPIGVSGIALRILDSDGHSVAVGSQEKPQKLTPGDNTLLWKVVAERVPTPIVPGKMNAVIGFRLSYD